MASLRLHCLPAARLQVFDHIPRFEECGAGLGVQSNGFAALDAIDERLCQSIIAHSWFPQVSVMHNLEGTPTPSLHNMNDNYERFAPNIICINRGRCQHSMVISCKLR